VTEGGCFPDPVTSEPTEEAVVIGTPAPTAKPVTRKEYCDTLSKFGRWSCDKTSCCKWKKMGNRKFGCATHGPPDGICPDVLPAMKLWVRELYEHGKHGHVGIRAQYSHQVRIIQQRKLKTTEWKEFDIPPGVTEFWIRTWKSNSRFSSEALLLKSDAQWDVSIVRGPPNKKRNGGKNGALSASEREEAWCPAGGCMLRCTARQIR